MISKMYRLAKVLIFGLFVTLQAVNAQPRSSHEPQPVLAPCQVEGVKEGAKCGTLEVFENRATRQGRTIKLNIIVLPAIGEKREPDPVVYFAGGPGSAATEEAAGIAQLLAPVRQHRDLLFVDQRGTGKSHPLNCNLYNPADPQSYLDYFFPLEEVRKCREQLESRADLTLYTTEIAMDDLDEVRAALGYEKLNLYGASYGTRAAQVYLKRHPKHVRTAILHGVSPTNHFLPLYFAQDTERALQGVLAECAANEACNKAFPNAKDDAQRVLEQLLQSPAEAEIKIPNSNERVKVKLTRNLAAEAIRYMLYHPVPAGRVPLYLNVAAQGSYDRLAEWALWYRKNLVGSGSNGMYLSVTCAEDLPWIKPEEAKRLAANTFLGEYRVRQQQAACELWPRATIGADYAEPVRTEIPVLLITGEWDPVTPPSNGDAVARTMTNSLHLVVPSGAHGLGGLEGIDCVERLFSEFIVRGATKGLDASCVQRIRRKGFQLKF